MAKKVKKAGAAPKVKKKSTVKQNKVITWLHVEEEIIIAGGGLIVIAMVVLFLV